MGGGGGGGGENFSVLAGASGECHSLLAKLTLQNVRDNPVKHEP